MSSSQQESMEPALEPHEWVDHFADGLYRYALLRLRDQSEAEEIVQDTFLAAIRNLHQFTARGSQRNWLMGILRHKIVDQFRRRAKDAQVEMISRRDPTVLLFDDNGRWKKDLLPIIAPDQPVVLTELWQVVRGCLTRLPPGQADAFVLSVMEEMDTEQICQQLEITPAALWVRLHRARLGMAKCVSARWNMSQVREVGHE